MPGDACVDGGVRIVGDHDDRLLKILVEHFQDFEDFLRWNHDLPDQDGSFGQNDSGRSRSEWANPKRER